MTFPSPPTKKQVLEAARQLDKRDTAIAAAQQHIDELHRRRAGLVQRLADAKAAQPRELPAHDATLIDLLVSDPTAKADPEAMAKAANRSTSHRLARDEWQSNVDLVQAALAKLDEKIAAADDEKAAAVRDREGAWPDFVRVAHGYLIGELRAEVANLRDRLFAPIMAMEALKMPTADGPGFASPRQIIDRTVPSIGADSHVEIGFYPPGPGHASYRQETLLPKYMTPDQAMPVVERFRASLGASAAPKPA